jgi:hypothetical protein
LACCNRHAAADFVRAGAGPVKEVNQFGKELVKSLRQASTHAEGKPGSVRLTENNLPVVAPGRRAVGKRRTAPIRACRRGRSALRAAVELGISDFNLSSRPP